MDISIDEKRVYGGGGETVPVYVVGEFGVAVVETSDDLVGEFGLERQCTARDAAGEGGRVAVATDEDVLIGGDEGFEGLGVGPAVAVGFAGEDLLVAREDGEILRGDGENWTELGDLDGVAAIDGQFVATDSGVYRATDELDHVGLEDARDVSAAGVPLAATGERLYKLANGWMAELDGAFRAVSAASEGAAIPGWAHAAGESGLFAREDGEWRAEELPAESEVVALDHGEGVATRESDRGPADEASDSDAVYAVTEDGTFLLSVGDGWRAQLLGLRGVRAVAAP